MTNPYDPQNPPQPPPGQYPGYPGQPGYPGYGYAVPPRTNGLAIASMVVSIVAFPLCWGGLIAAPVGAILGHVALKNIKNDPQTGGTGMARTGIIVGWIQFGLWILMILFLILAMNGAFGTGFERELA